MTNFEAAVELSLNNWVASLPTEFVLPEPTVAYNKGIEKLMDKMRGDRYHRLTRSTARALLIAAIIIALATVTFAATVGRDFIVQKFGDHSSYKVVDVSDSKNVDIINIGYLPDGFEMSKSIRYDEAVLLIYSKNEEWINVSKANIIDQPNFETEHKNSEKISIKNYEGVYFENPAQNYRGLVFNDGEYVFTVECSISKEELIRIAENIT